jgi:DUF1009 family protein
MIAIIAGKGRLPIYACQSLLNQQEKFFIIILFPEDNFEQITATVGSSIECIGQQFYKLGAILKLLQEKQAKQILFIGKVDKQHLLSHIKFDLLAIKLLASVLYKSDTALMERLVQELATHNIEVIKQADVLKSLMVPPGILCGALTKDLESSINMGIKTAVRLSECDIGQTIVVKNNMILAVEAIEGTDSCIKRGIEIGKTDVIICKAAHTDQNKKFDLPTLGPNSIKHLQPGQVAAIAWIADKTLIAEREEFIKQAQQLNITLVSYA